jgi:hypothetical protein
MTGFNHTLAGTIVAVIIPTPLVPIIALLSHFLLDTFPHFGRSQTVKPYNKKFKLVLIIDAVLCFSFLGLGLYLFPDKQLPIVLGVLFATLPDFLYILRDFTKAPGLKWFFNFSEKIQWGERPWGWILEILYAVVFIIIILNLR